MVYWSWTGVVPLVLVNLVPVTEMRVVPCSLDYDGGDGDEADPGGSGICSMVDLPLWPSSVLEEHLHLSALRTWWSKMLLLVGSLDYFECLDEEIRL